LNHRVLVKDTEQDLDSTPSLYWEKIEQEAERLLRQKINRDRRVRLDDTTVVVSVNDRSQARSAILQSVLEKTILTGQL
jgi:hypothetical protein